MTLRPPVEPMLAQAAALPGPAAPRAGVAYEQKLDGHRALLFTAAGPGGRVLMQSRRGALVQDRWPDLVAAAEAQLPHGPLLRRLPACPRTGLVPLGHHPLAGRRGRHRGLGRRRPRGSDRHHPTPAASTATSPCKSTAGEL
ncbi:predicted protein [Streptomyces sp. C]|nr:predicted protein [Streptomyces sp. C]